jgi:23S rRNA (cytidine2498-2'-O)-methyltransferase
LTAPDRGYVSFCPAPGPWVQRHLIVPFAKGIVPIARDIRAPSRAFAKLAEAEIRLGRTIARDEVCVDLGAAPGGWTYYALARGARVLAVDRGLLRDDLMRHSRVEFRRGDAFAFRPARPVDWLLCDVISAPERSIELLFNWIRQGWCRHFVVTIKFKGTAEYPCLDLLQHALPECCDEFRLARLCANRNEACAAGSLRQAGC